jgi:hypothetical protein
MKTLDVLTAANENTLSYVTELQKGILESQRELLASAKSTSSTLSTAFPTAPPAPEGRALLEETFAFQAKLLDVQKDFALGLLDVWVQEPAKSTKK